MQRGVGKVRQKVTIREEYVYDHASRVVFVAHQIGTQLFISPKLNHTRFAPNLTTLSECKIRRKMNTGNRFSLSPEFCSRQHVSRRRRSGAHVLWMILVGMKDEYSATAELNTSSQRGELWHGVRFEFYFFRLSLPV